MGLHRTAFENGRFFENGCWFCAAFGSVRLFCPASACPCGSEAQGVLVFNRKKDNLILQLRSL